MLRSGESRQQIADYPEMRFSLARHMRKMSGRLKKDSVDSIGQRNSYVKTWGCGGFLNETNI
ncbi:hypothetical protein, partial [Escherichia coli]|uniref:hypothetical protein n=1 Tax=Escherichia coli TaxID=562 RepID=UPI001BC89C49